MDLDRLQQRLGHRFADPGLLRLALTHRSYGQPHNERLEFLGDSIVNCVIAAILYRRFERMNEGELSRLRSHLVRQQALYEIAQELGLGEYLQLGEGEVRNGGARRPSMLADTLEGVLGAVHLDGGFDAAQNVIHSLYEPVLRSVDLLSLGRDPKTLLQEWMQARKLALPVYSIVATHGAPHSQVFEVACALPTLGIQVQGTGASRRSAEQEAARRALDEAQAVAPEGARQEQGGVSPRADERSSSMRAGR
jgi:ribonuclease-3